MPDSTRLTIEAIAARSSDHYAITRMAIREAERAGYRRIGIALDAYVDNIAEGRFLAAYFHWEESIRSKDRVPHFSTIHFCKEMFCRWYEAARPEVVICIDERVLDWLREMKVQVPETTGVIHLDWKEGSRLSGIRQKHEATAAAAVDLIVGQLNRNDRGIPTYPKAVLLGGEWVQGTTTRGLRK